jgi:uncharacterized protein YkwD
VIRSLFSAALFSLASGALAQSYDDQLFSEINLARTQPQTYARIVAERGPAIGNSARAVAETVRFLQKQKPVAALALSQGLTLAAQDHVQDTAPRGIKGHAGSDGSRVNRRADRYGRWDGRIAENLCYGRLSARDMIVCLIIDEGVRDLYHRRNIFEKSFRFVGVASGAHATMGYMMCSDFAAKYTEGGRALAQR